MPVRHPIKQYGRDRSRGKKPADSALPWTIFILLLIALVFACWFGTFYVFGHPEKPFSYDLLTKLKKLDPPRRFELTNAPAGEFLSADKIYERFSQLTPLQLQQENEKLLRNFLRNFRQSPERVPYVTGVYNILDSFELQPDDFFESGVVAVARSKENPNVLLEHVFTAAKETVPTLHRMLLTGLDIRLQKSYDLSAIIWVDKLKDGRVKVTAIPLAYPGYASTSGPGTFTLEPPEKLNVAASLPVVHAEEMEEADEKYASYRRRNQLDGSKPGDAEEQPTTALVRIAPAVSLSGEPPVLPAEPVEPAEPPVARALPADGSSPPPIVEPSPTPQPVAAVTSPSPAASPSPEGDVPLKPFLANSSPAPEIASGAGRKWRVYEPGQMPRGRLLNMAEAAQLVERGVAGETVYLQGNFYVTASGNGRAVLRAQGGLATLGLGPEAKARVIVDFPSGAALPAENSNFSRNSLRPFQITEVRRSADGEINVFVREITR